jgi:hypothetical protein
MGKRNFKIGDVEIGLDSPLFVMAGPLLPPVRTVFLLKFTLSRKRQNPMPVALCLRPGLRVC